MEKRGIDFLYPIWHLIERTYQGTGTTERRIRRRVDLQIGIGLTNNDVKVFYTAYINDFKRQLQPNEHSISTALDEKLTPGKQSEFDLVLNDT